MRDIHNKYDLAILMDIASISASTKSKLIDIALHEGVELVVPTGAATGVDVSNYITPVVQHSDTNLDADYETVPANFLLGSFGALEANSVQRVGYIGGKKNVRVHLVETGAVTSMTVGVLAMIGHSRFGPPTAPTPETAS